MKGHGFGCEVGAETGLHGFGLGEEDRQGHHRQRHLAQPDARGS